MNKNIVIGIVTYSFIKIFVNLVARKYNILARNSVRFLSTCNQMNRIYFVLHTNTKKDVILVSNKFYYSASKEFNF